MQFPIDLTAYKPLELRSDQDALSAEQESRLSENIQLVRDSIIFFTAYANARGLGGHTGGPYDIVPEVLIVDACMRADTSIYPVFFDEAGHRVAIQYLMAVLHGYLPAGKLLHYREFGHGLYGHPERDDAAGVFFSSGRLGHLWSYVNGIAVAHPDRTVVLFGSDGSQQEGSDAEAARCTVAQNLNIKLLLDANDVTIAGHPSKYMQGFSLEKTLSGHGLPVDTGDGEDYAGLFQRIRGALQQKGPRVLVNTRSMAIGVKGIEGLPKGHDVIPVELATDYLAAHGREQAVTMLSTAAKTSSPATFLGSTPEKAKNRDNFGKFVCEILAKMPDRGRRVRVVDSDLEGSCGLHHIRKAFPEIFISGGIMERNNFSLAAGFGAEKGRQGIFGTFSAFMEMVISEITMARLNGANVLAHFSHAGVDDMADNTCHFGINNFFADNGLGQDDTTRLYFPADSHQMKAVIETVFDDPGLRFIFSTRSATPFILTEDGRPFFGDDYRFETGRDELIREGDRGYIVTYGEMLYRCLDVVEHFRSEGIHIGLVNKPTLNVIDEKMLKQVGRAGFVLVVETQNVKTGLGARYGTWLLESGFTPRYAHMGTCREGHGGLAEQIGYQGMGRKDILARLRELL